MMLYTNTGMRYNLSQNTHLNEIGQRPLKFAVLMPTTTVTACTGLSHALENTPKKLSEKEHVVMQSGLLPQQRCLMPSTVMRHHQLQSSIVQSCQPSPAEAKLSSVQVDTCEAV